VHAVVTICYLWVVLLKEQHSYLYIYTCRCDLQIPVNSETVSDADKSPPRFTVTPDKVV